jgi:HemY protein
MIRVAFHLVLIGLVATGFAWLADRPGGLVLRFDDLQIESSLGAAAVALILLVVAIDLVWRGMRFVLRLPATIGYLGRARNRGKGIEAVTRGMIAVGSGDVRLARRAADEARKRLGPEPLALLLQAQAAQLAGDRATAETAFRTMLEDEGTRLFGLRGLFVEARRRGDETAALAHADEALRLAPGAPWAGEAVLERHCAAGGWTEALAVLDRASSGLDREVVRRRRAVLLTAAAQASAATVPETALAEAKEALRLAPDLAPAAGTAGRLLIARGDLRKASKLLENAWRSAPHPEIGELYVHLRHGDAARDRLARAERLLLLQPDHPESRYAVAKAALETREFDRVRSALQPLLAGRPTVRICLLMARMEEIEHGDDGQVREWLARATGAPRDEAWIADGLASESWAPVSPVSGRLDAFRWTRPVDTIAGPGLTPYIEGSKAEDDDPASTAALTGPGPIETEERSSGAEAGGGTDMTAADRVSFVAERGGKVRTPPSEVVFPYPSAPDDPGPGDAIDGSVPGNRPPA